MAAAKPITGTSTFPIVQRSMRGEKGDAVIRKSDLVCSLSGMWRAGSWGRADDAAEH